MTRAVAEDPAGVAAVLSVASAIRHAASLDAGDVAADLAWVIERESGWSPAATNKTGGATGLIQFMPKTAAILGTTTDALRAMSRAEQAPYVAAFYARTVPASGLARRGDIYLATFLPQFTLAPDDQIIAPAGSIIASQNRGLADHDGAIRAGTVRRLGTAPPGMPHVEQLPRGGGDVAGAGGVDADSAWLLVALIAATWAGRQSRQRRGWFR